MAREPIDLFVLDALANDLEDLESVLRILNSPSELGWRDQHPAVFTREEVIPAVFRGIGEGNIEACVTAAAEPVLIGLGERKLPDGPLDEVWFRLTKRGRTVLNSWDPPPWAGESTTETAGG